MSARPEWLSDEMLAEMRRLKGSSEENQAFYMAATGAILTRDTCDNLGSEKYWVSAAEGRWGLNHRGCWLTEAGHKALAAIEAEEQTAGTPIDRSGLAVETRRAYHEDAVFHHAVDSIVGAVSCGQMAPELARQVSDAVGWILDKRRPSTSTEGGGS